MMDIQMVNAFADYTGVPRPQDYVVPSEVSGGLSYKLAGPVMPTAVLKDPRSASGGVQFPQVSTRGMAQSSSAPVTVISYLQLLPIKLYINYSVKASFKFQLSRYFSYKVQ